MYFYVIIYINGGVIETSKFNHLLNVNLKNKYNVNGTVSRYTQFLKII